MKHGGRPSRFDAPETIELFVARKKGKTLVELATEKECDPDTITKAVDAGQKNLLELVREKGLYWVAGRFGFEPTELLAHL